MMNIKHAIHILYLYNNNTGRTRAIRKTYSLTLNWIIRYNKHSAFKILAAFVLKDLFYPPPSSDRCCSIDRSRDGRHHAISSEKNRGAASDPLSVRVLDLGRERRRETRGHLHRRVRTNANAVTADERERRELNARGGRERVAAPVYSHRHRETSDGRLPVLLQRPMARKRHRQLRATKERIDCSGKERKADAAIRRVHFTRAPGSLDVFRVRDGKTRESQTNVFVFRRFRSSSARDCVSRRRERREESSPHFARANCREDDLEV